jgi:hypothetical protein
MNYQIEKMDAAARMKMVSAKSLNRITHRNLIEENRLNLELDSLNRKQLNYSENEYYKALRSVHEFIKNLSVSTGCLENKKRAKTASTLTRAIILDKLLASGLLNSFSDNANTYLKRVKNQPKTQNLRSTTVSWLTFDEIDEFESESDETDAEEELSSKPVVEKLPVDKIRPFTYVVRKISDSKDLGVSKARFQSKSAQLFPTGNFIQSPVQRRKGVTSMYTNDDDRKIDNFVVLEPEHVQKMKINDPVFAQRYKKFVNSKLSNIPAKYPKDDALERVTMLKSAIEREKKRIIAGISPERTAVQQFNLNHQQVLNKKVKQYLKNIQSMKQENETARKNKVLTSKSQDHM